MTTKENTGAAKAPSAPSAKEQIAALSDDRLKALAFKTWRAGDSKNDRARKKAARLRPLLRAEIAAREGAKA